MSHRQSANEVLRLPPIGFEQIEEEPKPLKKKKKKKHGQNKMQTIVEASARFNSAGQTQRRSGTSDEGLYPGHPHPVIEQLPPNRVSQGNNDYQKQPVELRRRQFPRDASHKEKRFTVSDFEMDGPNRTRQQSQNSSHSVTDSGTGDLKELLRKLYTAPERNRIDYVISYKKPDDPDTPEEKRKAKQRCKFEALLEHEDFVLEPEIIGDNVFCKLHCRFRRLCKEAERVKLQMPLKNMQIDEADDDNCITDWIEKTFATDDEVDFVSAPFEQAKLHKFKNCEDPDLFFRSALRCVLTDHCLKNLDMRDLDKSAYYYYHQDGEDEDDPESDILAKQGLPYLLMKKVYDDAFILHDESIDNFKESQKFSEEELVEEKLVKQKEEVNSVLSVYGDARHDLNVCWPNVLKFQPLWKIRNYFGEEIALYFAWAGLLIMTIMIPMLIGLAVFIYGLYCSSSDSCGTELVTTSGNNGTTTEGSFISSSLELLERIKDAFDNDSTLYYAAAVCLWSTIFMELWKRKNAVLSYEWDVDDFDSTEPDRPSYYGIDIIRDPITQEEFKLYPFRYKCIKYSISFATFLTMVCVVLAILISVVVYRVVIRVTYCEEWEQESSAYCFMVTTVGSSLLNAIAIMILGKIYEKLAVRLTDWENHRTASVYRDALIIKLFAFQFANSYASLYYIAFFRSTGYENGILGLGSNYNDTCGSPGASCMADLSFQVLVLMIIKPLPRLLKDVILPWVKKKLKSCCKKKSAVDPERSNEKDETDMKSRFLETEKNKPPLQDFTLNEYTEKVIQYGLVVLFAAAMPIGPLIAVLVNTLDRVVDSKRILWMYRRPVPIIAQDIGMWQNILEFLNIAAVITNAFLIAYVSKWGINNYREKGEQLWVALVFEHAVFILKYTLAVVIPDVPHKIRIAMRKEKFTVAKILETGSFVRDFGSKSQNNTQELSSQQRPTPEGERKVDSANYDTATTTEVALESRGVSPRHRHVQLPASDVTDGRNTGNLRNESPKMTKSPKHMNHPPTPQPHHQSPDQPTPQLSHHPSPQLPSWSPDQLPSQAPSASPGHLQGQPPRQPTPPHLPSWTPDQAPQQPQYPLPEYSVRNPQNPTPGHTSGNVQLDYGTDGNAFVSY